MPTIWLEDSLYKQVSNMNCWPCAKCYIHNTYCFIFTIALGSLYLSSVTNEGTEVPTGKVTYLKLHNTKIKAWSWIQVGFHTRLTFFFFLSVTHMASLRFQDRPPNKGTLTIGLRKMWLGLKAWIQTSFAKKWSLADPDFPLFLLWCSESQLYISNKKIYASQTANVSKRIKQRRKY